MSEATDIFFKKIVTLRQGNHRLQFRTSQELFSSQDVDAGTKFLLRTLTEAEVGRKVLDVGCGYGPIGLALKRADKRREVHLLDRDALALDYARQNAALNQLTTDVEVYGSLGYEAVTATDFDLIVSHIPSKLGEETLSHFLLDGRFHLAPNGFMAVVIAPPQAETASAILQAAPDVTILLEETSARYTVFHYRFAEERPSPPETSQLLPTYHRDTMQVAAGKHSFLIQTARGLPEFDELGHHTKLLLKAMTADKADGSNRLLIFNPGQGHIAVAAWHLYQPQQMVIVDRDLLSLHFTQHNLLQNGCPAERIIMQHQVGVAVEQTADRIIGVLGGTEGLKGAEWTMAQAVAQLGENGRILAAANSHLISQLTPRLPKQVKVMERKRRKGNSLIVLQKA